MYRTLTACAILMFASNTKVFCQSSADQDTTTSDSTYDDSDMWDWLEYLDDDSTSTDTIPTLDDIRALIDRTQYDSAMTSVDSYINYFGEDGEVCYLKGFIYDKQENLQLASEYYHKSIALDSTYWGPWRDMAYIYDIYAQYDSMNAYMRKALETSDNPGSIYYDYGYSFDVLSQFDSALVYYYKALNVDSLDDMAYLNIGAIWGTRDSLDSARVYTEKAIALNPNIPRACYNYAAILSADGEIPKAIDYYQKALALDTNYVEVKLRLGELYEQLGDSTMAKLYFQEFVNSAPMIYNDDINRVKSKLENYR
jgi:tetratricopeptide (TPR) repeat protein